MEPHKCGHWHWLSPLFCWPWITQCWRAWGLFSGWAMGAGKAHNKVVSAGWRLQPRRGWDGRGSDVERLLCKQLCWDRCSYRCGDEANMVHPGFAAPQLGSTVKCGCVTSGVAERGLCSHLLGAAPLLVTPWPFFRHYGDCVVPPEIRCWPRAVLSHIHLGWGRWPWAVYRNISGRWLKGDCKISHVVVVSLPPEWRLQPAWPRDSVVPSKGGLSLLPPGQWVPRERALWGNAPRRVQERWLLVAPPFWGRPGVLWGDASGWQRLRKAARLPVWCTCSGLENYKPISSVSLA